MPLNFNKLQDKHVLVIGGSSGIGLAVAEGALASGARVTISSSSPARISAAISDLTTSYPSSTTRLTGIQADLSDPSTLESVLDALFSSSVSAHGDAPVNHVVFTAADALSLGGLDTVTPALISKAAHMRLVVPLLVAKVATRYLPKERHSSLTFTSGSVTDKPGASGWALIGFLAGGAVSMARALAIDLAPVRVNVVQPGYVDTPLWGGDRKGVEATFRKVEEDGKMLTGKVGEVEDVAEAYLWVMRDGNVTGTVAKTDGGFLLT